MSRPYGTGVSGILACFSVWGGGHTYFVGGHTCRKPANPYVARAGHTCHTWTHLTYKIKPLNLETVDSLPAQRCTGHNKRCSVYLPACSSGRKAVLRRLARGAYRRASADRESARIAVGRAREHGRRSNRILRPGRCTGTAFYPHARDSLSNVCPRDAGGAFLHARRFQARSACLLPVLSQMGAGRRAIP